MSKKKGLFSLLYSFFIAGVMSIGFASGISQYPDALSVNAEEEAVYKTALFGSLYNSANVGSYTGSFSSTNNGFTVNIANFNNNNNGWSYIKTGNKTNASVGTITTNAAIDEAITKVVITIDAITATSVNSITLYSGASSSACTTSEGTFTKATGPQSVTISSPAGNKFYKISFDCKKGSSNGLVTVSKVEYYHQISSVVSVSGVSLNESSKSLNVDETFQLTSTVAPENATNKSVTWESSDPTIASVDSSGLVTAISVGNTTISVKTEDGECTAECVVNVTDPTDYDALYRLSQMEGFYDWGDNYSAHNHTYGDDACIELTSAAKSTQTITNYPVTKGEDVIFKAPVGKEISSFKLTCLQWGNKTQTITLHTSTNGTDYTATSTTSVDFVLSGSDLENVVALKFTFSSKSNQVGIQKIEVVYEDAGAPTLSSITVKTAPTTTYIEGQYFNPAGLVITKRMSNSSEEDVAYNSHTSDFSFTPSTDIRLSTTNSSIKITYMGKDVDLSITVNRKTITSLVVSGTPTKTSYYAGDTFDPSGLIVTAAYDNGDTAPITEGFDWEIDYGTGNESFAAGTTSIDVCVYIGSDIMSDVYTIDGLTVTAPVTLTSITVSGTPTKTTYNVGDAFETAGLVVTGTYSNNSNIVITEGIEWTVEPETLSAGITSIDVIAGVGSVISEVYTVNGITVNVPVILESITVSGTPNKLQYFAGESFDPSGLVVTANYSDETHQTITEGITWSTPYALTAGQTFVTVTATYGETTSNEFTVNGLSVQTPTTYTFNGDPSESYVFDMEVSDEKICSFEFIKGTDGSTSTPSWNIGANEYRLYGRWVLKVVPSGKYKISAIKFDFVINANSKGASPDAKYYDYDALPESLSADDLSNDLTTSSIFTETYFKNFVVGAANSTAGNIGFKSISILYSECELTSIAVSGTPSQTTYSSGSAFNPDGLIVTGTYEGGGTEVITSGITWNCNPTTLTTGMTSCTVTATCNGINSAPFTVNGLTVTKVITSITIGGKLSKTEYLDGDVISLSGLTVTAHYDDGTSIDVTSSSTLSCDPTNADKDISEYTIEVSYAGFGASTTIDYLTIITPEYVNIDLTKDYVTSASDTELSWKYGQFDIIASKGNSQTATNNFYPGKENDSTRFYKNSTLVIAPRTGQHIYKIVFEATTDGYATTLANSTWTNATASANGKVVTVTVNNYSQNVSVTIGNTTGHSSIKVYCDHDELYDFELLTIGGDCDSTIDNWKNLSIRYSALSAENQSTLRTTTHEALNSYEGSLAITDEHCVARYDAALSSHPDLDDFMTRKDASTNGGYSNKLWGTGSSSNSAFSFKNGVPPIVIGATFTVLVTLIGYTIYSKRKEN